MLTEGSSTNIYMIQPDSYRCPNNVSNNGQHHCPTQLPDAAVSCRDLMGCLEHWFISLFDALDPIL